MITFRNINIINRYSSSTYLIHFMVNVFCKRTTPLSLNNSSSFPFRFIILYLYELFHEEKSCVITCHTILIIGKWLRNLMIRTFVDICYMMQECTNISSNFLCGIYSCRLTKKYRVTRLRTKKQINYRFYENYQINYKRK